MRVSCKLGREVLDEAARVCDVGVTTDEIDRIVHEACIERDCYPSPLNYYEFPKSCCTSVNEVCFYEKNYNYQNLYNLIDSGNLSWNP